MTPEELRASLARVSASVACDPTPAHRRELVAYREDGRDEETRASGVRPGGCGWMSEWVDHRYGWLQDGGCYLPAAGEKHAGRHVAHLWNVLPDGRIIDATADQWDPKWPTSRRSVSDDGIRICAGNDVRYLGACDGETCNNGAGAD